MFKVQANENFQQFSLEQWMSIIQPIKQQCNNNDNKAHPEWSLGRVEHTELTPTLQR